MLVYLVARQRLRHKVRRVFSTEDLVQTACLGPNKVLHPKLSYCKVAHFAYAAPVADTYGCSAVCVDFGSYIDPEISRDALQPQHFAKAAHYCPQLGFT